MVGLGKGPLSVLCIGIAVAVLLKSQHPGSPKNTPFEELREGVFRHLNDFPLLPAPFLPVPTASWLIRGNDQKSWILIDAGPSTPSYQKSLKAAVSSLLSGPDDEIKLILLTHGHPDHVEGLPWLLEKYPKAQLAFHEKEAPFVTGGHQYKDLKGDTLIFELGKHTQGVDSRQPQQRAVVLKGRHGDVAGSLTGFVTGAPAWLPQGFLEFLHTPGHSPGHLVFIHKPTQSVIAGDAFSYQSWGWPFFKTAVPRLNRPYPIATVNSTAVQVSQKQIANLPGMVTAFASHDDAAGSSAAEMKAWTGSFPDA
ncbi:hypothetical protein WJX74_009609 [Apatococcus lobatus]|uniref:Metallo-beta-lactamase domain-containing protein n=2 Tax=Apatococcus TaxID=904362 RepID=A0AAW1T9T6_9CHLO